MAMVTITVYGPGCAKCKQAEQVVQQAAAAPGTATTVEVQKVTDYQAIVQAGVMATPAVAVNGTIRLAGRVPKASEVQQWIAEAQA